MNLLSIGKRSTRSLVGLAFDGPAMTACAVRLSGGRVEVGRRCRATLALDPLSGDPQLAGREIRTRLDEAGIRGRRCVVCIPLKWALTMQTDVPDLSQDDEESFLRVQAERGFPFAIEDLAIAVSRYRTPGGGGSAATLVALPANRLAALEKVLRTARLQPVSVTFGVSSLLPPLAGAGEGTIAFLIGENGVELEVRAGGGTAALRSLEESVVQDAEGIEFDPEGIARQIRITLGQVPQALRASISSVRVYGPDSLCRVVADELRPVLHPLRLLVEIGDPGREAALLSEESLSDLHPSAVLAAARRLLGASAEFEILPPRPSRLERITSISSRRGALGFAAVGAALLVLFVVAFLVQSLRLSYLERKWRAIEPQVRRMETVQAKVREFRSWFDDSARVLTVARRLTQSFPEDGAVWASSLDVRGSEVSCAGQARSDAEWIEMREKLRGTPGIRDLQVRQIQGASPLRFSLSYRDATGETDGI